ncbi:MAG: TerC/Alx family metal homeostasis membrane protein [Steroidobacteraceae bacterium]|jgi:tellurite resistance protein TerC|nr:TerC/Alx family metal homeostasis membrane protein [Steroidobacteraceae bacterium]
MSAEVLGTPAWLWLALLAIAMLVLAFDLGMPGRRGGEIGVRQGLAQAGACFAAGLAFGAGLWWQLGAERGQQYLTAYLMEKTLAMDDALAIAMVFTFLAVPRECQHRVLFWGIIVVVATRALVIALGAALVGQFDWVLYLFAAIVIATGLRMLLFVQVDFDVAKNPVLRWLRTRLRVTDAPHGERFWVRLPAPASRGGAPSAAGGVPRVWWATPSLLALVLVACAYLVSAMDSVPAILVITQDPFIACAAGTFGILGLRALYFALAALIHRFRPLKHALALVLLFVGAKVLAVDLLGRLPAWASLAVTVGAVCGALSYSRYRAARRRAKPLPLGGQEAG